MFYNGWYVCRDGGYDSYVIDDWTSYDRWKGEKRLNSLIVLDLVIYGKRDKRGKLRPYRYCLGILIGHNYRKYSVISGSCKSVKDACFKADSHPDYNFKMKMLLKDAYSPRGCESAYKKIENDYVPFATLLGIVANYHMLPNGNYIVAYHFGDEIKKISVKRNYYGYCSGPIQNEERKQAEKCKHWVPKII